MAKTPRLPLIPEHRSAKFLAKIKIITPSKGNKPNKLNKSEPGAYKASKRVEKASKRLDFMSNRYDDFEEEEDD